MEERQSAPRTCPGVGCCSGPTGSRFEALQEECPLRDSIDHEEGGRAANESHSREGGSPDSDRGGRTADQLHLDDGLGQSGGPAEEEQEGNPHAGSDLRPDVEGDNPSDPEVEVIEGEDEMNQGLMPRVVRAPRSPTPKERELHEAIHLPHAEWCEFCVRGRSRNKVHPSRSARRQASQEGQGSQEEGRQGAAEDELGAIDAVGDSREQAKAEGDTDFRSPEAGVPRVSLDYFLFRRL